MRYLAIDLCQKRTGLAVGDDTTGIATPLQVIATASVAERDRLIAHAIDEHGPDALVVGLPVNMDGTEGPAAKATRTTGQAIAKRFGLPVHFVDERLSS